MVEQSERYIPPSEGIGYVFEEAPQHIGRPCVSCLSEVTEDVVVIGMQLNPIREALGAVTGGLVSRKTLKLFLKEARAKRWTCLGTVAVLPNFDSPRFFFPLEDAQAHQTLLRHVLSPRRYSLIWPGRLAFRVLTRLQKWLPSFRPDVRYVYVRLQRT